MEIIIVPMKKNIFILTAATLALCACGSSSSSTHSGKGGEAETTVDKATFEKLITNGGLIDIASGNVSLKYESTAGELSYIKNETAAVEIDMQYPGGNDPAPVKYYLINNETAWLTLMNPSTGKIAAYLDCTHDEAMKDIYDMVGIVGSGFVYEQFAYNSDSKAYHSDAAKASSGVDMSNVNLYFESNLFQKATGTLTSDEGSFDFTITAYDYGKTKINIPY